MLKMLENFGILVHHVDELPPAFGGIATDLPSAPVMQAQPVASAPMLPPPVLPMPRAALLKSKYGRSHTMLRYDKNIP